MTSFTGLFSRVILGSSILGKLALSTIIFSLSMAAASARADASQRCKRVIHADIVAIDQPLMFNRLGAQNINGMVFALKRDVVDDSESMKPLSKGGAAVRGHVFLRPDKRPRPVVLRVAAGDCLDVQLTNLLTSDSNPREPLGIPPTTLPMPAPYEKPGKTPFFAGGSDDQVADRMVGFHVQGMQLRESTVDDGTMVGVNLSGLVAPGGKTTYHYYAEHEGTFLVSSHGATFGGDATAGNSANGLFGAVTVEPTNARFYRSQVTEEEMRLAASTNEHHVGGKGSVRTSPQNQPVIDYEATYPDESPWREEGKAGLPILNILKGDEIIHTDINAIIAGPDEDGSWASKCPEAGKYSPGHDDDYAECPYPLEKVGRTNPSLPKRLEPFREFTVVFHDEMSKTNAFPHFYNASVKDENGVHDLANPLWRTLKAVGDVFMINYGSGGIGSEIIANRLGVGPMHDCLGCAAEEFFLTSHAVGDPAMVVDVPANFGLERCRPISSPDGDKTELRDCGGATKESAYGDGTLRLTGRKATRALYPDDPSNVHHSYIGDHVKFRNLHTGKEHHIFHLHNHQWLYNPNDDNSNYLDAQAIGPGGGYTYEINFGGSGNRNKSAGDAIFHCHLYPHFAQGMWELWRNHDVFETGTPLEVSNGLTSFHKKAFGLQDGKPARDPSEPARRMRALPDGEIAAGTPIPALVPLPGKAMAPMPGKVNVVEKTAPVKVKEAGDPSKPEKDIQAILGSLAKFDTNDPSNKDTALIDMTPTPLGNAINPKGLKNPGYPFWIGGIEHTVGQRPPTPPLDMLPAGLIDGPKRIDTSEAGIFQKGGWDGGLPRHSLDGVAAAKYADFRNRISGVKEPVSADNFNRTDLSKRVKVAKPVWFAEDGTEVERAAMAFHAVREHPSSSVKLGPVSKDKDDQFTPKPEPAAFITNGGKRPVAGAPFHNPCIDDKGKVLNAGVQGEFFDGRDEYQTTGRSPFTSDRPRIYKGADIQFDAVLNKAGWHFPQERIIALWEDALPTISKAKAPEPLVMRNNTFDCTMFLHTNLVPEIYEWDDYQVRTSTDIIGQHIHLPKWDLTTTDGSGNGWNYEDGTLSPGAVRERIDAINDYYTGLKESGRLTKIEDVDRHDVFVSQNLLARSDPVGNNPPTENRVLKVLSAAVHPYFPEVYPKPRPECGRYSEDERSLKCPAQAWKGARTTLQRWFFDPVVNAEGDHRGLGLIFTHDHFGPSTHQQVGLYATVLVEPPGSVWTHNETGERMASRPDGGPTSWQALIKTGEPCHEIDGKKICYEVNGKLASADLDRDGENDSYREFYLEYSDFQHAYLPGVYVGADPNGAIIGRPECKAEEGDKITFAGPSDTGKKQCDQKSKNPYWPTEESYKFAINPPLKDDVARTDPDNLVQYAAECDVGGFRFKRPCAEAITADDPGTFVVNYRNEPIGLRILDPRTGLQAHDEAGDLAYALQSFGKYRHGGALRAYSVKNATFGSDSGGGLRGVLNTQPREGDRIGGIKDASGKYVQGRESTCFPRPLQAKSGSAAIPTGLIDHYDLACQKDWSAAKVTAEPLASDGDPFTPILRVYDADRIRMKIQAGGDEETHNATVHGVKWLQGGSGFGYAPNSGWRNSQQAGISEQFTFASPLIPLSGAQMSDMVHSLGRNEMDSRGSDDLTQLKKKWDHEKSTVVATASPEDKQELEVQTRGLRDYLYSIDASTEGYWNGSWGLMRAYKGPRDDLQALPNNTPPARFVQHKDVCDASSGGVISNLREFDISVVLANDVLENKVEARLDVSGPHPPVLFGEIKTHVTGTPDDPKPGVISGGTLVYNPRKVAIRDVSVPADPVDGALARAYKGHPEGILHDPTAIMYVYTSDLEPKDTSSTACFKNGKFAPESVSCPGERLKLKESAPIEPLVLRAAAGDCIKVTLRNLIGAKGAPDVRTYRQLAPVIPRFPDHPDGTVLNANRVRTSSVVGLHPALVAYDVATDDGTAVGVNDDSKTLLPTKASGVVEYIWYAGDISLKPEGALEPGKPRQYHLVHTPVEFGGVNLMPADKIKQGQKGLVGALVIEPQGSTWTGLGCKPGLGEKCLDKVRDHQGSDGMRGTRLSTTVKTRTGDFRDMVTVLQKGLTQIYGDGSPVEGVAAEVLVAEDTEDSATMAINYGSEPLWYRFGLLPLLPFNGAKSVPGGEIVSFRDVPNAHEAYSNSLVWKDWPAVQKERALRQSAVPVAGVTEPAGGSAADAATAVDEPPRPDNEPDTVNVSGEPSVPVLVALAGKEFRMRLLQPSGNARATVFNLHGHVWQRAPYICRGSDYLGIKDVCSNKRSDVASRAIGHSPLSMYLGGQDSILPASHFDIVLPHAGGVNAIEGDYLYKDQASFGNLGGLWGIVRVMRDPAEKDASPSRVD